MQKLENREMPVSNPVAQFVVAAALPFDLFFT